MSSRVMPNAPALLMLPEMEDGPYAALLQLVVPLSCCSLLVLYTYIVVVLLACA